MACIIKLRAVHKRQPRLAGSSLIIYNPDALILATVAQLVEQRPRNAQVVGSCPTGGSDKQKGTQAYSLGSDF